VNHSTERLIPPVADLSRRGPFAWIDLGLSWTVIVGLLALTLALVFQVVARYVFGNPTIWSEELAISLFVWVAMLAIPLGFRRGEHLAIDVLSRRLRPVAVKALATLVSALSVAALGVIGYYALLLLSSANRQVLPGITEGLGIPAKVSWVYAAVPVGCAMAIVFILERLWAVWAGRVVVLNADADVQVVEQLENDLSRPDGERPAESGVSAADARSAWRRDDVSTSSFLGEDAAKKRKKR
jgi:TRAP-type C4-dicarboxylate transport system permease small subunit